MSGKFIVFEGIDGAGKDAQAISLFGYLKEKKIDVELTREPSDGIIGKFIRENAKEISENDVFLNYKLGLLFAADRFDHIFGRGRIADKLYNDKKTIISTRYKFSNIAYNSNFAEEEKFIKYINKEFIEPDLVIYLDIDINTAFERINKRGGVDYFETTKQLISAKEKYDKIFKKKKNKTVVVIDGTKSIEEIQLEIRRIVNKMF
jgi:dTMP kinase